MRKIQAASFALAVCVCAGIAFVAVQGKGGDQPARVAEGASDQPASRNRVEVRIPGALAIDTPQPFALDAETMRRAVREGQLRVALPDGTRYPVRIERQYTDRRGQWNVVGRADTRLGPQPMVMTFGGAAVFGVLPQPDGNALHVTTGPRGTQIAPSGGLVPRDLRAPSIANDAVLPPTRDGARTPPSSAASAIASIAPRASASTLHSATMLPKSLRRSGAAPIDTTPVDIELYVYWTPEQETLRGNWMAVETELSNIVAIANQAHIDSGSRVRFVVYNAESRVLPTSMRNKELLQYIATADDTRNDIRKARRDLAFVLRPRVTGDNCGAAYVTSTDHARTGARIDYGYGVINTDGDCSPMVFAHESGHSLGAMHDRASETNAQGRLNLGAYVFSHGHRTDTFATLMAMPTATQPWVPYFSNPALTLCNGESCGVADSADDVRNFNLMAPAIASFRTGMDTGFGYTSVASVEGLEPRIGPVTIPVEVRLQGGAGAYGMDISVSVVGGTAERGVDYELDATTVVHLPPYATHFDLPVRLLPDDVTEGDETIQLRINAGDYPFVDDSIATFTIVEAQRFRVTGKLRLDYTDQPNPTTPIEMDIRGIEDSTAAWRVKLSPPDYAYAVDVPFGAQVELGTELTLPYWLGPQYPLIPDVRANTVRDLFPIIAYRISGQVRAEAGTSLYGSQLPMTVIISGKNGDTFRFDKETLVAPDYRFSILVPRGLDLTLDLNQPGMFTRSTTSHFLVGADKVQDIIVGKRPSLRATSGTWMQGRDDGLPVLLDGPAPAGGVTMRCRTVDGTAKAGSDYVAMTATLTIPEGEQGLFYCGRLKLLPDTAIERDEFVYIELDQVTNAIVTTPRAPIRIWPSRSHRTGGVSLPEAVPAK